MNSKQSMPLNKHATKMQLKKLLEENSISKTSNNIMTDVDCD